MYPPLPILNRRCTENYTIPETNITIEKGTAVAVPVLGLHYDEEFFPEPNKFDPNRFSEENIRNIKPYTYIPFGDGPRNCLGKLMTEPTQFSINFSSCRTSIWRGAEQGRLGSVAQQFRDQRQCKNQNAIYI